VITIRIRKISNGYAFIRKKALIVVNADVTVAYDLHKMKYDIDEKRRPLPLYIFQRRNKN
jgi:hypothetical protein